MPGIPGEPGIPASPLKSLKKANGQDTLDIRLKYNTFINDSVELYNNTNN